MVFVSSYLTDHKILSVIKVSLARRVSAERYQVDRAVPYERTVGPMTGRSPAVTVYTCICGRMFRGILGISDRLLKEHKHTPYILHITLREKSV